MRAKSRGRRFGGMYIRDVAIRRIIEIMMRAGFWWRGILGETVEVKIGHWLWIKIWRTRYQLQIEKGLCSMIGNDGGGCPVCHRDYNLGIKDRLRTDAD